MKVHEIMTAHARCVGPDNTLVEVAGVMRELDVGALPICDNDRLAGMVTDRDMVLRGVAEGRDPVSTAVREVMSPGIVYCFADQDVEEAARTMEAKQIRRLPVLSREKRLVGIVSLGDIATSSNPAFSGTALREVSQPHNPTPRQRRLLAASEPPRMEGGSRLRQDSTAETPRAEGRRRRTSSKRTTSRAAKSRGRSSPSRAKSRGAPKRSARGRKRATQAAR